MVAATPTKPVPAVTKDVPKKSTDQDVEMKPVEEVKPEKTEAEKEAEAASLVVADIKQNLLLLEKAVATVETRFTTRALRNTATFRRKLTGDVLRTALEGALKAPADAQSLVSLISYLPPATKSVPVVMDIDGVAPAADGAASKESKESVKPALPEVEVYLALLVILFLHDQKSYDKGLTLTKDYVEKVGQLNRRTLDQVAARIFFYYARFHELKDKLAEARSTLLAAHRTASLRRDDDCQATLVNLLLRNFLHYNLYDQAEKLVSKASFPETASNNQIARYMYYLGRVRAINLDYTSAKAHLQQAIRKGPTGPSTAGFLQAASKLLVCVQLLMGEIPERSAFGGDLLRKSLAPYLQVAQAVRIGDLSKFNETLQKYGKVFKADRTYTLILRVRHNVIKTGIRMISLSYSRISLKDICLKLQLDSEEDAEYIVAKAIRDGVIDATLDHEKGYMKSRETADLYSTNEPQSTFDQRIAFCLALHNESVKAMRFPGDTYRKELGKLEEMAEEERKLVKEIEEVLKLCTQYLHHVLLTDTGNPESVFEALETLRVEALAAVLGGVNVAVDVVKACVRGAVSAATKADNHRTEQMQKPIWVAKLDQALRSLFDKIADRDTSLELKGQLLLWTTVVAFKQINKTGSHTNFDYYFMKLITQPWNDLSIIQSTKADLVSYHFLVGVYRLTDHHFLAAEPHLAYAFRHCTLTHPSNRRRALTFLSAARLILGRTPPQSLIEKYGLSETFTPRLVDRWRIGDYHGFMAEVESRREWWSSRGLYSVMKERTKLAMWRNLLKRTHSLLFTLPTPPPHFTLEHAHIALLVSGYPVTMVSTESAVRSLARQKLTKFRVLHESGRVVPPIQGKRVRELWPGVWDTMTQENSTTTHTHKLHRTSETSFQMDPDDAISNEQMNSSRTHPVEECDLKPTESMSDTAHPIRQPRSHQENREEKQDTLRNFSRPGFAESSSRWGWNTLGGKAASAFLRSSSEIGSVAEPAQENEEGDVRRASRQRPRWIVPPEFMDRVLSPSGPQLSAFSSRREVPSHLMVGAQDDEQLQDDPEWEDRKTERRRTSEDDCAGIGHVSPVRYPNFHLDGFQSEVRCSDTLEEFSDDGTNECQRVDSLSPELSAADLNVSTADEMDVPPFALVQYHTHQLRDSDNIVIVQDPQIGQDGSLFRSMYIPRPLPGRYRDFDRYPPHLQCEDKATQSGVSDCRTKEELEVSSGNSKMISMSRASPAAPPTRPVTPISVPPSPTPSMASIVPEDPASALTLPYPLPAEDFAFISNQDLTYVLASGRARSILLSSLPSCATAIDSSQCITAASSSTLEPPASGTMQTMQSSTSLDSLPLPLLCTICTQPFVDPFTQPPVMARGLTPSSASFQPKTPTCPQCRAPIEGGAGSLGVADPAVLEMVKRCVVRCVNRAKGTIASKTDIGASDSSEGEGPDSPGCSWIGPRALLQAHLETCLHSIVTCSSSRNGGCGRGVQRRLLPNHRKTCMEVLVGCSARRIPPPHKQARSTDITTAFLPGCVARFPRGKMSSHAAVCPFRAVRTVLSRLDPGSWEIVVGQCRVTSALVGTWGLVAGSTSSAGGLGTEQATKTEADHTNGMCLSSGIMCDLLSAFAPSSESAAHNPVHSLPPFLKTPMDQVLGPLANTVSQLTATVSELSLTVTSLQTALSAVCADASVLERRVVTLETKLETIQREDLAALRSDAVEAKRDVESLKVLVEGAVAVGVIGRGSMAHTTTGSTRERHSREQASTPLTVSGRETVRRTSASIQTNISLPTPHMSSMQLVGSGGSNDGALAMRSYNLDGSSSGTSAPLFAGLASARSKRSASRTRPPTLPLAFGQHWPTSGHPINLGRITR
ncbi:26S proteasome non-ATPase regulatory subunit 3 [Gonapodya sp. JEL0774]|nr:26S proteasome non-ATPase regulatory subunit 3 [Gonapodya sp. JEL0774]